MTLWHHMFRYWFSWCVRRHYTHKRTERLLLRCWLLWYVIVIILRSKWDQSTKSLMFTRARPGQLVRGSMRGGDRKWGEGACSLQSQGHCSGAAAARLVSQCHPGPGEATSGMSTASNYGSGYNYVNMKLAPIKEMKPCPSQSGQQRFVCYCFLKELNITEQAWILHGSANYT